jgi:hypothetical protein
MTTAFSLNTLGVPSIDKTRSKGLTLKKLRVGHPKVKRKDKNNTKEAKAKKK